MTCFVSRLDRSDQHHNIPSIARANVRQSRKIVDRWVAERIDYHVRDTVNRSGVRSEGDLLPLQYRVSVIVFVT